MTTVPIQPKSVVKVRSASIGNVVFALLSRLVMFALLQGLLAAGFAVGGHATPWAASVPWWPVTATIANLATILLLSRLLSLEGKRWRDFLHFERTTVRSDLLVTVGLLVVAGVLAMVPNIGLATLLWGNPEAALATFIQPLPVWAGIVSLIGFPLSIALSELPTYYGYVRPRLEKLGMLPWQAVALAGLVHGLQHATLPLVFDGRFLIWRSLMFLPFALFVGAALRWRPRLLPYLMIVHGLLDATVGLMVLQAST